MLDDDLLVEVVEDDAAMRDALSLLLASAGIQARGFASAEEFLRSGDPTGCACLLTDVRLPGMDGLSLHRRLLALGAEPAVVVITGHGDIAMAVAALKAGALDFVEKPFDPAVLLDSVRAALRRAGDVRRRRAAAREAERRLQALTDREREILELLVQGHANKTVAARLGISVRTAEHHRANIMEKAGARSLSQLLKMALRLPG
jgi:two-component system, LuxR family, response regulator FixJ